MKHIVIEQAEKCCGCSACQSVCPVSCISMVADRKGFQYPRVDEAVCIECGACVRVCPFINVYNESKPLECRAAINLDEVDRRQSSSGGIFILLAERVLAGGGVVFGAVFNEESGVEHRAASSLEEIRPMMTSKYVQSSTAGVYPEVRAALAEGREVLFTGTQCQIAGLRHYLGKDYDGLYAVEVTCHGVPSPRLWEDFIAPVKRKGRIVGCNFRDKRQGWRLYTLDFSLDVNGAVKDCPVLWGDNLYNLAFRRNFSLRPSCFACMAKGGRSHADLTLGDFWGVKEFNGRPDDDRGVSGIMVRSQKGMRLLDSLRGVKMEDAAYDSLTIGNGSYYESAPRPQAYDLFWDTYFRKGLEKACMAVGIYSYKRKYLRKIKKLIKKILKK